MEFSLSTIILLEDLLLSQQVQVSNPNFDELILDVIKAKTELFEAKTIALQRQED